MIDALEGLTDQDKKISQIIVEDGRAFIIAVNKWDAIENKDTNSVNNFTKKIQKEAPFPSLRAVFVYKRKNKTAHKQNFPCRSGSL